jgi:hypothetical protein
MSEVRTKLESVRRGPRSEISTASSSARRERRFERTLLVALTGRRHGLHASLTRMATIGEPDDDLRCSPRRARHTN